MGLESTTNIAGLVPTNPLLDDTKGEGDDHIRLLKTVLQATFPGLAGAFGRVQGKTASYNFTAADNHSVIVYTAGSSPTLSNNVSAGTLGTGFAAVCLNFSGSTVTFDPLTTELINSVATLAIPTGHGLFYWCDGANWWGVLVPTAPVSSVPVGLIAPFAGSTAPSGWLQCSGQQLFTASFPALFSAIGYTHGGSGSVFNLPDLRGRVPAGCDVNASGTIGRLTGASGFTGFGSAGGHELMQQHIHNNFLQDPGHSHSLSEPPFAFDANGNTFSNFGPGAQGHNIVALSNTTQITLTNAFAGNGGSQNVQPTLLLSYIIKY